ETTPLAIWASTPFGSTTGALAILDIILLFSSSIRLRLQRAAAGRSEYGAENLATHASGTRSTVGHHTLVGGDDGDAEAGTYLRQLLAALVRTQAWRAATVQLFNDRLAIVVLERDIQLRLDHIIVDAVAGNVTFLLQHFEDRLLDPGRGA